MNAILMFLQSHDTSIVGVFLNSYNVKILINVKVKIL